MSTTAKTIFVASCIFTGIVVYKVHEYQDEERKVIFFNIWTGQVISGLHKADTNNKNNSIKRMREGVYKDLERRSNKLASQSATTTPDVDQKQQNLHMLEKQAQLHLPIQQSH